MAYTKEVDIDKGHLDDVSSGYYADGFHEVQLGMTSRRRSQIREQREMIAALGVN